MKAPNIIRQLHRQSEELESLIEGDKAYLKNKEYVDKSKKETSRWKKIWEDRLSNHQKQLKEYKYAIKKLSE